MTNGSVALSPPPPPESARRIILYNTRESEPNLNNRECGVFIARTRMSKVGAQFVRYNRPRRNPFIYCVYKLHRDIIINTRVLFTPSRNNNDSIAVRIVFFRQSPLPHFSIFAFCFFNVHFDGGKKKKTAFVKRIFFFFFFFFALS